MIINFVPFAVNLESYLLQLRFVLVVGNNTVCGIEVENHKILPDIASSVANLEVEMALVDNIRSRGMITKRHETAGMVSDEWIVVFKKN